MRPLPYVWPYAPVFWVVFVWAFTPEFGIIRRAQKTVDHSVDARSMQVIMLGMWIAFFTSFGLAWVKPLQVHADRAAVYFTGCALMVAGSLLRRHCWRMLGESFTGDVRAREDQQVVTRGAYAVLRHPSYTAGIILNVGVGLALDSWASALLMAVASFAVYVYRMNVEERALAAAIGEPYVDFMRTRKRLIPFVY